MSASPVLMSVFALALLLPVLYGRYRRRSGATPAGFGTKRGRWLVMGMASIVLVGVVGWFVCGYALMFGAADQSKILGLTPLGSPWHIGSWNVLAHTGFFLGGHAYDVSVLGFFFFQLVFMDATATIPTGAMAERWKFSSFVVWGLFASMLLYPIYGNWVWGGGWRSQLGTLGPMWGHSAVDFAG